MVDAFSNYAKSERLELQEVDINRLIEDVVELYQQLDEPIDFRLELDSTLNLISLDYDGVRQILNNIIGNACDALKSANEPYITITTLAETQQEQAGVSIIVEDNGTGFDEGIIDQVFEPYATTKVEGTGLGMAIVKRITQAHGGFVVVNNRAAGGQVKVWLPVGYSLPNTKIKSEEL